MTIKALLSPEPWLPSLILGLLLACAPPSTAPNGPPPQGSIKRLGSRTPGAPASFVPGWSATRQLVHARGGHTATLLPSGKLLVLGGFGSSLFTAAELYDPDTSAWSFAGSLSQPRKLHTATLLLNGKVLVAAGRNNGSMLSSAEVYDPTLGSWSSAGSLRQGREHHSAALLPNGKVLAVGGYAQGATLTSTELYDPTSGSWSETGPLNQGRYGHTLTRLPNGQVLAVGGFGSAGTLNSAELFDPDTGVWSFTTPMAQAHYRHTATLLPDGKVLVAGGYTQASLGNSSAEAEVYDPVKRTWSSISPMTQARVFHTSTLLPSGKLLVVGGSTGRASLSSAEEYDPSTGAWSPAGSLGQARAEHSVTLLPDGELLVAGGYISDGTTQASCEVYDLGLASRHAWSSASPLRQGRQGHPATLLPDGKLLVAGGFAGSSILASAEVYDSIAGTWMEAGSLNQARHGHTLTLIPGGRVLVVGGATVSTALRSSETYDPVQGRSFYTKSAPRQARSFHTATLLSRGKVLVVGGLDTHTALSSAEIYDPVSDGWLSTSSLAQARSAHTATLLPNGKLLVVGGGSGGTALASTELYDPGTANWSFTGSLSRARRDHTTTLLPNGRVLVVGGSDGSTALASAEVYDPITGMWSSAGSMAQARTAHAATLLSNGQVLVLGGRDGESLTSAEVYDSITGDWSPAGSLVQARSDPTATLLPGDKVLITGGTDGHTTLTSTESYLNLAGVDAWRPLINRVSPILLGPGVSITVTGERFRGFSEGSSGNFQSSPSNGPLLSLRSLETGLWIALPGNEFSSTSVEATVPSLPGGYYLLTVTTQGLSSSRVISITASDDPVLAPDTLLASLLPDPYTQDTKAVFSFSSAPGTIFECRLGQEDLFESCTNPKVYQFLRDGDYFFQVRARDLIGNTDPTPAEYSWTVDTSSPDTLMDMTSVPRTYTHDKVTRFAFSSSEPDSTFECLLGGNAFTACAGPQDYAHLLDVDGRYTFSVRAIDKAGNIDLVPSTYSWVLDTEKPRAPEFQVPAPHQEFFTAHPVFSGIAEPLSTVTLFVDGEQVGESSAKEDGSWEIRSSSIESGPHRAWITATDLAENTSDPSPEEFFTTSQRGVYGLGCTASPPVSCVWPWLLLTLRSLQRTSATLAPRRHVGSAHGERPGST